MRPRPAPGGSTSIAPVQRIWLASGASTPPDHHHSPVQTAPPTTAPATIGSERLGRLASRYSAQAATAPPVAPKVLLAFSRPNPVQGTAQIDFTLSGPAGVAPVTLRLYNAQGRLVRTLMESQQLPVPHSCSVPWDGLMLRTALRMSNFWKR